MAAEPEVQEIPEDFPAPDPEMLADVSARLNEIDNQ